MIYTATISSTPLCSSSPRFMCASRRSFSSWTARMRGQNWLRQVTASARTSTGSSIRSRTSLALGRWSWFCRSEPRLSSPASSTYSSAKRTSGTTLGYIWYVSGVHLDVSGIHLVCIWVALCMSPRYIMYVSKIHCVCLQYTLCSTSNINHVVCITLAM